MTIINGLVEVPDDKEYFCFQKTPEIMDWLKSQGYFFNDLYVEIKKCKYACITKNREKSKVYGLANSSQSDVSDFDITEQLLVLADKNNTLYW